jgi:hypothetical protein
VTALEDLRRRWVPIPLPADLDTAFGGALKGYEGPVWFRCGVRLPESAFAPRYGKINTAIFCLGGPEAMWVNGLEASRSPRLDFETGQFKQGEGACIAGVGDFQVHEPGLVIVKFSKREGLKEFTSQDLSIDWAGPRWMRMSLHGTWEVRIGDDPSWKKPALPAKFALSPQIYFEPTPSSVNDVSRPRDARR